MYKKEQPYYYVEDIKCGHKYWQNQAGIKKYKKCPFCTYNIFDSEVNSLKIIHPEIYSLIELPEEEKENLKSSSKKIVPWKCPECGLLNTSTIRNLVNNKIPKCHFCGKGYSYGERILYTLMELYGIYQFKPQFRVKTEDNHVYIYDLIIFVNGKSVIVEIQGDQHYKDVSYFNRTLEAQQIVDEQKMEYAVKQLNVIDYIIIKYSSLDFYSLYNSIIQSNLRLYLSDIDKINIDQIIEAATKNTLRNKVINIYKEKEGLISARVIGEITGINECTVNKILKDADKLDIITYKRNSKTKGYVYLCKNNHMEKIFTSITDGAQYANTSISSISRCSRGLIQFAGYDPVFKEKCKWIRIGKGYEIFKGYDTYKEPYLNVLNESCNKKAS